MSPRTPASKAPDSPASTPTTGADAIGLSAADNVATLLHAVAAGDTVRVSVNGQIRAVVATGDIPLCHKISLAPLKAGARVIKYGQPIGSTLEPVAAGAHVHVHNMRSNRARR